MAHIAMKNYGDNRLTLYDGLSNINKMTIPSPGYTYTNQKGENYPTIVLPIINEHNISIAIYNGKKNCGYNLRSIKKINFTKYKYLEIEMNSIRNTSEGRYLGAMATELESGNLSDIAPITAQEIFWEPISTTKQTYTYDISNITGKKYLVWGTAGGNDRGGILYKIKLIHK